MQLGNRLWDWLSPLLGGDAPHGISPAEERLRSDLRRLSLWLLLGLVLGGGCVRYQWPARVFLAVLWAGAFYAGAFLIGFLFGIPRVLQSTGGNLEDERSEAPASRLAINTNLEQVSDWLVKILVGLGLTELKQAPAHIYRAANYVAPSLSITGVALPGDVNAAGAIVVYFSVLGFLSGYLITRLLLGSLFRDADSRTISPAEAAQIRAGAQTVSELWQIQLDPTAAAVAAKIQRMSLDEALREGIDAESLALAKLNAGRVGEALEAYREAIRLSADDARLRMNFAFALRQADRPYRESVEQLAIARSMLGGVASAAQARELKLQIYRVLTYFSLYLGTPESFNNTIFYANEYLADGSNEPSADVNLNLACAYGQEAMALGAKGEELAKLKAKAFPALERALQLQPAAKGKIGALMHPSPAQDQAGENDLKLFADDPAFEALLS